MVFELSKKIGFQWSQSFKNRSYLIDFANEHKPAQLGFFWAVQGFFVWKTNQTASYFKVLFISLQFVFDKLKIISLAALCVKIYTRFWPPFWIETSWKCFTHIICFVHLWPLKWYPTRLGSFIVLDSPSNSPYFRVGGETPNYVNENF